VSLRPVLDSHAATELFRSPEARLELVRNAWRYVVGPELARRTRVLSIDAAVLRVQVPDGRWRRVLHRLRGTLLNRLAGIAGSAAPRRIGFIEAPLPEAEDAPSVLPERREATPPPAPDAIAASAEAIPDPELRRMFLESAARYLARTRSR